MLITATDHLHLFSSTAQTGLHQYCASHTEKLYRARICKRLRSPEIESEESITPAYVAWQAGNTNRGFRNGPSCWESISGL